MLCVCVVVPGVRKSGRERDGIGLDWDFGQGFLAVIILLLFRSRLLSGLYLSLSPTLLLSLPFCPLSLWNAVAALLLAFSLSTLPSVRDGSVVNYPYYITSRRNQRAGALAEAESETVGVAVVVYVT